jgi:serine O-acetyltransferase
MHVGLLDPERLVRWRTRRVVGPIAQRLLRITAGIEIPSSVRLGDGVRIMHGGFGLVIHDDTTVGNRVRLFQGVTLGRSDVWMPRDEAVFGGIEIADDACICAGAKVIGGASRLRVGRGTVVGANAVLLESTGDWEIWAGVPARMVGKREAPTA